jgi:hypothetical protein
MTKIELNADQERDVVVNTLIWDLDYILDNPWDYDHSYEKAYELARSILWVIEHYTTKQELEKIYTDEILVKLMSLIVLAAEEKHENLQNTES